MYATVPTGILLNVEERKEKNYKNENNLAFGWFRLLGYEDQRLIFFV
jgi:hypothetical protein